MNFNALGLMPQILKALARQGYTAPSPIQTRAIPPALAGRDVLGCAQTGTGKTCAFATPILQRLACTPAEGRPIRALVVTPTRELALQIYESFLAYGRHLPLRSTVVYGGVGQGPQVDQLRRGVDILVATPGRLLDLQGQGLLDLSHIRIFVLDEADRMLDMGFIQDVHRIIKLLPAEKQTLFFSATMPPEVTDLVNTLLKDPVRVAVDPISSPVEVIAQSVYLVDKGNKTKLLAQLIGEPEVKNALVFTRTKHGANKVAQDLAKTGLRAAAIHGNKSQTARQQALADFKAGQVKVLVATDIAARGIDIEELSHVFNYNLPEVPETYVHRIGRTGRAGHGGTAISFCDFGEKPYLKGIEKLLDRRIPVVEDHPWPMAVFEVAVKDAKGRAVNADDAEARAAAKERRRARDAEHKAKAPQAGRKEPPVKSAAAAPEAKAAPARRGRRGHRLDRLEDTLPTVPQMPKSDYVRPDPLAGEVIMDATARMLAPRSGAAKRGRTAQAEAQKKRAPSKKKALPPEQAAPAPSPRSKGRRTRDRRGPPPVQLRTSRQKDSTEQPSLMKPYYLGHEE